MAGRDVKINDQHSDGDPDAVSYGELSADDLDDDDMDDEGDGYWYIFGMRCKIDVDHCALCFVFPRGRAVGGVVDEQQMVEDPYEKAKRIFDRPMNVASKVTMFSLSEFQTGPVSMVDYQEKVRTKFMDLLMRSHLILSSFDSIDGDEVFLKVGLNRHGSIIKELAERYKYHMPYCAEAYEHMPPWGNLGGGAPMKNHSGHFVYAYDNFSTTNAALFQPFRDIDEIRLILMRLDRWVNLHEMMRQKVFIGYFPAISPRLLRRLCNTWANPYRLLSLPRKSPEFEVREYFGEEVAFFFLWMSFAIWALAVLFIPSLAIYIFRKVCVEMSASPRTTRIVQKSFGCMVLFGAGGFSRSWKHYAARVKQMWGMEHYEYRDPPLSSYNPYLEGTYSLWCRKFVGNFVICIYLVLYINVLIGLEWVKAGNSENDGGDTSSTSEWDVLLLTAVVRILSLAWSYIAKIIVKLQNHRTRSEYRDGLAFTLAVVKVFIALWPFLRISFVKNFQDHRCYSDMQVLVQKTWPNLAATMDSSHYALLMGRSIITQTAGNRFCVAGCFLLEPINPEDTFDRTNCSEELRQTLQTYYLYDQVLTVIFLCVPVVRTMWSINQEMKIAASKVPEGVKPPPYSLLQYQAKCYQGSPYKYGSWGGSYTEDFLQVIIGFVLMMCFAIVVPGLCCIAFVGMLLLYRLFAFRMTRVTCRPLPMGAEGIGFWESFISACVYLAILINVGIAIFNSWPLKGMDEEDQLEWFIISEHSLFAISLAAGFLVPSPSEIPVIQKYNDILLASLVNYPPLPSPASERYDYSQVDVSLRPRSKRSSSAGVALW
eukprot:TRINITY_DN88055_c0_g1_i1.p1 TRINITY_DN88055_c0_g1~~TRINITY_DN88055_c0_g1_i1.p1  ORF type:complete len:823 (-),score=92.88 TRINITY_DN88055_c0_g1_i1:94-2562(-)